MNVLTLPATSDSLMHLLWWHEHDGSGCVLLRIYQDFEEATADMYMIDSMNTPGKVRVDSLRFMPQVKR